MGTQPHDTAWEAAGRDSSEAATSPAGHNAADSAAAPQAPATYPVTYRTGESHQVHHSYIWLGPLTATLAVLAAAVGYNVSTRIQLDRFLEEQGMAAPLTMVLVGLAGFVAIYIIVTLVYVLAWRNMRYVFDETEFSLYSGIITKRRVHVPYARVQSVNHRAGLVQRLFGVCSVSIDTAGGAANKAVRVPFVTLEHAERIRSDLFVRKAATMADCPDKVVYVDPAVLMQENGTLPAGMFDTQAHRTQAPASPDELARQRAAGQAQPNVLDDAASQVASWRGAFGGGVAGMEPVQFEQGLTNKELLLTATTSSGIEVAVVTLVLMGVATGIFATAFDPSWAMGLGAFATLAFTAGIVLFGLVAGCIAIVLSYGNFRVRRRGSRVEVERGLLQRVFTGIDLDRIQTVEVRQSFVRRCLGYCEVSLGRINTNAENSGQNKNQGLSQTGLVVHPFLRVEQAEPFVRELLPELAGMPEMAQLQPLPQVALRRGIVRNCIWRNAMLWIALAYAAVQIFLHALPLLVGSIPEIGSVLYAVDSLGLVYYIFAVAYTVVRAVSTVLWQRGSGHALNRGYVALFNDGLRTSFTVVPRAKVQSGYTRTNPFQRMSDVTTLVATTAAGAGHTSYRLWDVTESQGAQWLAWLEPRR